VHRRTLSRAQAHCLARLDCVHIIVLSHTHKHTHAHTRTRPHPLSDTAVTCMLSVCTQSAHTHKHTRITYCCNMRAQWRHPSSGLLVLSTTRSATTPSQATGRSTTRWALVVCVFLWCVCVCLCVLCVPLQIVGKCDARLLYEVFHSIYVGLARTM
jgi:hypothetical protein